MTDEWNRDLKAWLQLSWLEFYDANLQGKFCWFWSFQVCMTKTEKVINVKSAQNTHFFSQKSAKSWNKYIMTWIVLHWPSYSPCQPTFSLGPSGPRENMGWQTKYSGQYKTIHVIIYKDAVSFRVNKINCLEWPSLFQRF